MTGKEFNMDEFENNQDGLEVNTEISIEQQQQERMAAIERVKVIMDKTEERFFETTYDDPEIILIKVDALSAEFWDSVGRMPSVFKTVVPLTEDISKTVEF